MDTISATANWETVLTGRPVRADPARKLTAGLQIPRLKSNPKVSKWEKIFTDFDVKMVTR